MILCSNTTHTYTHTHIHTHTHTLQDIYIVTRSTNIITMNITKITYVMNVN